MRLRSLVILSCLLLILATGASADTILGNWTHHYNADGNTNAVEIDVTLTQLTSGLYEWAYHVINNSFDPTPGTTNGFSGFELFLPGGFPSDIGNVTDPGPGWEHNCCSGRPEEWDITNADGNGIMPGQSGDFSFTTLPRQIGTADSGWFHTWADNSQSDVTNYLTTPGETGPEAPNLLLPPTTTPEPGAVFLIGAGLLGFASIRHRLLH